MLMKKNPLAEERAIMDALDRGDKEEAERLVNELRKKDREATLREIYSAMS